ncbi:MAG: carboxypeptidase-like regulatory domain-containing protein, partial [Saprospiraceae bacterium]|nr:carboxypeptidase-like regulatory domain-containing protein [Saprospiraceae bacterium]
MNSMKLTLFVLACLPFVALGQDITFSGRVLASETKAPLEGATIIIADLNVSQITNSRGAFRFTGLKKGTYELVVFLMGKNTYQKPLILEQPDVRIEIRLTNLSVNLDQIEVEAPPDNTFGLRRLRAVEG